MTPLQSLRGMVDLLPEQTDRWQVVESFSRSHFLRSGCREIRTPLLEATDLFSRGVGESTDVVSKEMYTFQDRGDRSCTLRPEGTASVVRAALQSGLLTQGGQRLWYSGPMFRYERPQAGRQRQFHQIGVEWLGVSSSFSDAEVIALAWDLLTDLGVEGLSLEINTLGTSEDRLVYRECLVDWFNQHRAELDVDSLKRLHTNPLRILDSKHPQTKTLIEDAPIMKDSLSSESLLRFQQVLNTLDSLHIPYKCNHRLVRGLDYYTHTAFEITSDQLGAQSTVCGGGRYDGLVQQLGGPFTPSIGWALGMERLLLLIDASAKANPHGRASQLVTPVTPDIYIVNRGDNAPCAALILTRHLRSSGFYVERDESGSSFAKQFKRANRSGASIALVLGDDEVDRGVFRLQPLLDDEVSAVCDKQDWSLNDLTGLVTFLQKCLICIHK